MPIMEASMADHSLLAGLLSRLSLARSALSSTSRSSSFLSSSLLMLDCFNYRRLSLIVL
jgi:hypothetical protein